MPSFRLILNSFGLQGLKPVIYRLQAGQQAPAGSPVDYPEQSVSPAGNITGEGPDAAPKSLLGTPVFADVRFPREGKSEITVETVLVDVAQRKTIITTPVQGRNGTIKEYISDGDYDVRIRGAIVNTGSDAYPMEGVRDLHELLSRSEALQIVADYLRLFNIYTVVVTGFNFPQQEGYQNVQLFEIDCISDTPEELIQEE